MVTAKGFHERNLFAIGKVPTMIRRDIIWLTIAKMLPRKLIYWCAILVGVHATTGKYEKELVPNVHFMDVLERWEKD